MPMYFKDYKARRAILEAARNADNRILFSRAAADDNAFWRDDIDHDARITVSDAVYNAAHVTIRNIRDSLRLSQQQFADLLGVGRRTITNWEAENDCKFYIVLHLGHTFGLVPDFIVK